VAYKSGDGLAKLMVQGNVILFNGIAGVDSTEPGAKQPWTRCQYPDIKIIAEEYASGTSPPPSRK